MTTFAVMQQHKVQRPSFSLLTSSLSDFTGTKLTSSLQYKRRVCQPKGALQVTAKKILIMGGTRFIGVFLSRLLVKEGHQVTLFTRGKAPITQNLPGESEADYDAFKSQISHLKGDRKDFDFVRSSLAAEGFDVVYDINGREADEVEPILDALPNLEQYIYCSSAGVYLKSDLLPHFEVDAVDPKSRHKGKLTTEALLQARDANWTSIRPVYIYGPLNYNPIEEWFFHRLKAGRPIPIPGSGMQITQLGHVEDLAKAFVEVLCNEKAMKQIFNISGEKYVTFDGLARACAKAGGFPEPELVHYNPKEFDFGKKKAFPFRDQHFFTSVEKAKSVLGLIPDYGLVEGLTRSYELDFGSTSFLCQGWMTPKHLSVRLYSVPSRHFVIMRQSNSGSEQKRPYTKKIFRRKPPKNVPFGPSVAEESDSENSNSDDMSITNLEPMSRNSFETNGAALSAGDNNSSMNLEIVASNSAETVGAAENAADNNSGKLVLSKQNQSTSLKADGGEVNSNVHIQDLIAMIRHAEKNVHLLNQARICALEDLEKILSEKKTLQGEINSLEMRLAETDARIRVASQERLHVELLEDQLKKLQTELSRRGGTLENIHDIIPNNDIIQSLSEEVNLLRTENISLKEDLQVLKAELTDIKGTGERVVLMEKEHSYFESSVKELERKITVSQEDVSKLSTLKSECKSLWERVDHLQTLLDKATKQADQASLVLQENQVLRKKVEEMEETLEEANVYKISSEKLQEYNDLMQQKIKHLDERLQRSDEEIHSYIQLYQESLNEFQDTLNILREESKRSKLAEPANDMPRKFWSRMLLMVDAWYFEKKIEFDNASLLREMIWKRDGRIRDAYMECKEKNERETITTFLGLISSADRPGLHVIHIAAEMAPVAKVGGLGDVLTGLSKALQQKGHLVEVVLPKYDCMQYEHVQDLRGLDMILESFFEGRMFRNKVWVGTVEGLPVYFIEPHHPGNFFWRGQLYGEHDDFRRFSYFSRAALELLLQLGKRPDIIHCHDWQTAFVAPLYWDIYAPKGLNSARICFTCHNFEYQGTAPASELALCGLDVSHLNRPDRMQDHSAHDRINPLKGAIVYSNIVTTVSPTYAQEVRTAEGGKGLHSTLNSHSKKFVGILNGIDTDTWNPATDIYLKVQYSVNDLQGKHDNKEALRRQLHLSSADVCRPLVGCVTRLVPQKGVHLIRHAIYRTLELGGQFVLLGSSPVPHIQKEFEEIANHFQSHEHVRLLLKYDESLSHIIYAASDMLIIPSIFEPCGLTQMIAMKYGSVPVARKTGGLNDSVFDIDDDSIPVQFRNGYTFFTADEQGFNSALDRAIYHYKNDRDSWQQLVQKNMNIDFSWDSSALQYEELYLKSVARAKAANRS